MAVEFKQIQDMKRIPVEKGANIKERFGGFPVPMGKQMTQPPRPKLRFPKLRKVK